MRHLYDECTKEDSKVLPIYMDGRKARNSSLDDFLSYHISEIVDDAAFLKRDVLSVTDKKDDATMVTRGDVGTLVENLVNGRPVHKPGSVDSFVAHAKMQEKFPLILIDETNLFLAAEKGKSTRPVLQDLVSSTKQKREVNTLMASSEFSFPYSLREHGVAYFIAPGKLSDIFDEHGIVWKRRR